MAISTRFSLGLRRLPVWLPCHRYRVQTKLRSSTVAADSSSAEDGSGEGPPKIPLVPKRDPDAVLKALASTVEPLKTPSLLGGRSFADPLAPRNRNQKMQLLRAQEAGRRAAQYVIHRWPRMFPDRIPDSSPQLQKVKGCNESVLKHLIATRKTGRALKMYRKLMDKGETVSLETQNSLLALLAYYGLGNSYLGAPSPSGSRRSLRDLMDHDRTPVEKAIMEENTGKEAAEGASDRKSEEVQSAGDFKGEARDNSSSISDGVTVAGRRDLESAVHVQSKGFKDKPKRMWSENNFAEMFFAEMSEKNGASYDALISGLVKFKEYDRAMEMFQTMRNKGYQASLPTYNSMLEAIAAEPVSPQWWEREKSVVNQMKEEPIVMPDVTTFNHLLKLCEKTETSKESAIEITREMFYLGIEPTLTTFIRLMQSFLSQGDGSIVYEIVDYIENNEHVLTVKEELDLHFLSSAMNAARNLCDIKLAMRLKRIAKRDSLLLVNNFNFFWSHFLIAVSGTNDFELMKQEYEELVPKVTVPYEWIYGTMFRLCDDANNPEYALKLWNDMFKFRIPVRNTDTIARFCGALCNRIDLYDADRYIKALMQALTKVEFESLKPPEILLSRLVSLHAQINDLDKAWEYFGLFEKHRIPPTFLALSSLLNLYCGRKDTKKMVEIMEMMIRQAMVLPAIFLKEICWKAGLDSDTAKRLMSGFAENADKRKIGKQETTSRPKRVK